MRIGTVGKIPRRAISWNPARSASCRYSAIGSIARVLQLGRRANQTPLQQEVDSGLQVREVRNGDEQLTGRRQDAVELCERPRLLLEGQMLEDIEAERSVEGAIVVRQGSQ